MSFTDQLTLHNRAAVAQVYDKVSHESNKNSIKTVRRNAARAIDCPAGITIAHEKTKDGKTVRSAVMFDLTEVGVDEVTHSSAQVLIKMTYPTDGIITSDHLLDLLHQGIEFLTGNDTFTFTETNATKIKNLES